MSFVRQRIGLVGATEYFKIFEKTNVDTTRTIKSLTFALVNQSGFTSNLSVVDMPKFEVTLQTKDPNIYGVMSVGDLGHICVLDLLPAVAIMDVNSGQSVGAFPTAVFLNFKDVKTVDPIWMAIKNVFGPVEVAYKIEFSQKSISALDQVLATLGYFG